MGVTVSGYRRGPTPDQALAKVTRNNQLVALALPRFTLPVTRDHGKTDDGAGADRANGAVNLQIIVNQLYAVSRAACATTSRPKRISRLARPRQMATKMTKTIAPTLLCRGAFGPLTEYCRRGEQRSDHYHC